MDTKSLTSLRLRVVFFSFYPIKSASNECFYPIKSVNGAFLGCISPSHSRKNLAYGRIGSLTEPNDAINGLDNAIRKLKG
jgi:hypothetical protein